MTIQRMEHVGVVVDDLNCPSASAPLPLPRRVPSGARPTILHLRMLRFEWDPAKAGGNLEKHGVTFEEAATCFGDPRSFTFEDPDHSSAEPRYLLLGVSQAARLLVIAHTERGDAIRLISARLATPKERRFYEEGS